MSLVDSHCHPDDEQFEPDRDAVLQRAIDAGVTTILAVGTGDGPSDLEAAIRLAERHSAVLATAGIHPQHAAKASDAEYKHLSDLMRHPKCVGLGEIGLDYYWKPFDKELQSAVFVEQMRVAADARKPIVIHTRDAWADTVELLRKHWSPTGLPCIMHCFTGGPEEAREVIDLGFYVSFAGVVTYPKATSVQEAARMAPLDRLLIETDAPYLPPVPYRGKRNEPAYVVHTAARIAELRALNLEQIAAATSANFRRVFIEPGVTGSISYTEGFE
jgi:TatD DNase family protein